MYHIIVSNMWWHDTKLNQLYIDIKIKLFFYATAHFHACEKPVKWQMIWIFQVIINVLTSHNYGSSIFMMTSVNGNIFHVTGPLCGEFTGDRWIPLTNASDAEFLWFLWSASEQACEQTIQTLVIRDAIALMMTPQ